MNIPILVSLDNILLCFVAMSKIETIYLLLQSFLTTDHPPQQLIEV